MKLERALAAMTLCSLIAASGPRTHAEERRASAEDPYDIPAAASSRRNPVTASAEALQAARPLWRLYCQNCHGVEGRGDGPDARLHERRKGHAPRNLTETEVQENLTDGEIFWRISKGIIEKEKGKDSVIMPAFETKLPAEEKRWQLVLFVRELGRAKR
jgi:mono/diheme cytochrome c family protein